jgi:phosphoribosylanthranilate isomerase
MKDLTQLKPRELEAYFRDLVLKVCGNKTEDSADITSHSGSYYISFAFEGVDYAFRFKKKNANKIARVIRALK